MNQAYHPQNRLSELIWQRATLSRVVTLLLLYALCVGSTRADLIYTLNVGSNGENIVLDDGIDVLVDGRTCRQIEPGQALYFRVSSAEFDLDSNGVPDVNAVIEITYKDVIDHTSTNGLRAKLATDLDFGTLAWLKVGYFGGAGDDNWKTSRIFLENTPWLTLQSQRNSSLEPPHDFFAFRIENPIAGQSVTLPVTQIVFKTMSDFDAFYDERENVRTNGVGFVRTDYAETNTINPNDYPDQNYVVYNRNYLEKVFPNTIPYGPEITNQLSIFEIAGEREPATFALYAFKDLTDVQIYVSDLEFESATIASTNIDVDLVVFSDQRWQYLYSPYYGVQPWYLKDCTSFDVPAGESRQLWLTVAVPADTPPGDYTGVITVDAGLGQIQSITLSVTVHALDLANPKTVPYAYWSPHTAAHIENATSPPYSNPVSCSAQVMQEHKVKPLVKFRPPVTINTNGEDPITVDYDEVHLEELDGLSNRGMLGEEIQVYVDNGYVCDIWEDVYGDERPCFDGAASPQFDTVFLELLDELKDFFDDWNVTPVVSFHDEPNAKPDRRRHANHLNRLAHQKDLETWITYAPSAEQPLAGHHFKFTPVSTNGELTKQDAPDWMTSDAALSAYWSFQSDLSDASGNNNNGIPYNGAATVAGFLELPSENAYMEVPDDDSLDFDDEAMISLWFRPDCFSDEYALHIVDKGYASGGNNANYVLYYYGSDGGENPQNTGKSVWNAGSATGWRGVSNSTVLSEDELSQWHHILWLFNSADRGIMYFDGAPLPFYSAQGPLPTNSYDLTIGNFVGDMDEVVMLSRMPTHQEIVETLSAIRQDEATIILSGVTATDINSNAIITFSVYDADSPNYVWNDQNDIGSPHDWLETVKSIEVNGYEVWSGTKLPTYGACESVDLTACEGCNIQSEDNTITFTVSNYNNQNDDVLVYFHEDYWRNLEWTNTTTSGWTYTHDADPLGDSAPMDIWLDRRVYFSSYISEEEISRTIASGDSFAYYTTYLATQPVNMNNRFLNGIYPAALGIGSVYVWTHGAWGLQPYDDLQEHWGGKESLIGKTTYDLILPSWNDGVFPTIPYESLREGIEDSQVVQSLTHAIAVSSGNVADQAQDFLDDLFQRPSRDFKSSYMYTNSLALLSHPEKYADRSEEMLADLCVDTNGLLDLGLCDNTYDYRVFDNIRAEMIEYILKLTDTDNDTIADYYDNCPLHANTNGLDCDSNGIGDVCEIVYGFQTDCNSNGVPDNCDIHDETSADCNTNNIPDECEEGGTLDCNTNGVADFCDIDQAASTDCNSNSVPDECEGPVIYVDHDATGGLNDGSSWNDAYTKLEQALSSAGCVDGITEVRIAEGTYYPNTNGLAEPRDAAFQLINGVRIRGGYAAGGVAWDPLQYETILSGDIGVRDDDSDNSYHVFYHPSQLSLARTAVLDSVTVSHGMANGQYSGPSENRDGAGMMNYGAHSPTLISCIFRDNHSSSDGGAVYNCVGACPIIISCLFIDNSSVWGGAILNHSSVPTILACSFAGNTAISNGGAMCNYYAAPTVIDSQFTGNEANLSGGAVANYHGLSGDIPCFVNCTMSANESSQGGGIYNNDSDSVVTNCILWGNAPQAIYSDMSSPRVAYSCIENGYTGTGNINVNPLFIDSNGPDDIVGTEDDDLRLSPGSPCIDAGSNGAVPADTQDLDDDGNTTEQLPWDLDEYDRFVDDPFTTDTGTGTPPIVDMGAYEYWPDCNTNGVIDYDDIENSTSTDCNSNSIPDECEVGGLSDCNSNLVADLCDIYYATSEDSNSNGVPDECEPARPVMTEALSLKGHGSPATVHSIAAENTECRNGGISQVKFSFDKIAYSTDGNDFVAGDFTLSRGTITNVATTWDDSVRPTTAEIILDISGVTTMGQLTISFSAENSVGLEQYYEACWTYVPADVDNDGDVDDDDETEIIAADQGGLATYFRCDLDLDGTIEGEDKEGEDWEIWSGIWPISPQTRCGD